MSAVQPDPHAGYDEPQTKKGLKLRTIQEAPRSSTKTSFEPGAGIRQPAAASSPIPSTIRHQITNSQTTHVTDSTKNLSYRASQHESSLFGSLGSDINIVFYIYTKSNETEANSLYNQTPLNQYLPLFLSLSISLFFYFTLFHLFRWAPPNLQELNRGARINNCLSSIEDGKMKNNNK